MDVNFTYGVPLELNVTLISPPTAESFWTSTLGIALIGALFALIGALIASGSQIYLESRKNKELKRNNQIQAHSNLLGCKNRLLPYYSFYFMYRINEGNLLLHSRINAIKSLDLEDLINNKTKTVTEINQMIISEQSKHSDYHEGIRVRVKAEELMLEVTKTDEIFWSLIGQIKTLFRSIDLQNTIETKVKDIKVAEKDLDDLEVVITSTFRALDAQIKLRAATPP